MVNGITNSQPLTDTQYSEAARQTTKNTSDTAAANEAAVYEPSSESAQTSAVSSGDRSSIVAELKEAADRQTQQLRQLIEKMLLKQGNATTRNHNSWKNMADNGLITDDEATQKAAEDISENGYWGANQTSDRILSFAEALSGGDADKMKQMVDAVKKGFEKATHAWGGALPDLCQNTYSTVMDKFDKWFEERGVDYSTSAQ